MRAYSRQTSYVFLVFITLLLAESRQSLAQQLPERADQVNVQLTASVSFDAGSGLYTYSYTIKNRKASQQNVDSFYIEATGTILNPTSPPGWSFLEAKTGQPATVSWSATELPDPLPAVPADVRIESPFTIKPDKTLSGFSFQSPHGPGSVTYYIQGFTQWLTGDFGEDISEEVLESYTFENNSKTGTVSAPIAACKDGIDNDGDGLIDYGQDPGCVGGPSWPNENPECQDGIDNDGDSFIDFIDTNGNWIPDPGSNSDPECRFHADLSETVDCSDSLDNDGDGAVDSLADTDCTSATDQSEIADCEDNVDNDGDGLVDYLTPFGQNPDPSCGGNGTWPVEVNVCDDGIDNDSDSLIDFPDDPNCSSLQNMSETADCGDGLDNDGDSLIDFPEDTDCTSTTAEFENPQMAVCGDGMCSSPEDPCICPADCGSPPVSEVVGSTCTDALDNDCDGTGDCADLDCASEPICVMSCDNDGVCDPGEDCFSCSNDCVSGPIAECGNGTCEAGDGEDCVSCPADCNGQQSGNPNNRFCCGDGDGQGPLPCSNALCSSGGYLCEDQPAGPYCCGDGACEGAEDSLICSVDCGP